MELSLRLSDVDPKAAKEKMKERQKRKRANINRAKRRAASYDSSLESRQVFHCYEVAVLIEWAGWWFTQDGRGIVVCNPNGSVVPDEVLATRRSGLIWFLVLNVFYLKS